MTLPLFLDPATVIAFSLNVLLSLTIVCLVVLVMARYLFRYQPLVRYWVCFAGVIAVLCVPLVACFQQSMPYSLVTLSLPEKLAAAPMRPIPARPIPAKPVVECPAPASVVVPEETTPEIVEVPEIPEPRPVPAEPAKGSGIQTLLLVWMAGIVWGAVRFVRGWREVKRLTRSTQPWDTSSETVTLAPIERILGCPLPPIHVSSQVSSPMAVGLLRPVVILPEGLAENLTPSQLRHILLHECTHIAHRHLLSGVLERVVRLLFWPHPLVLALCHELEQAREEVCDTVAAQEGGAASYARTLFAIAQGTFRRPLPTAVLALMGASVRLEERIAGLLHPRRNQMITLKHSKPWPIVVATVLMLGLPLLVRVTSGQIKLGDDEYASSGPDEAFLRHFERAKEKKNTPVSEIETQQPVLKVENETGPIPSPRRSVASVAKMVGTERPLRLTWGHHEDGRPASLQHGEKAVLQVTPTAPIASAAPAAPTVSIETSVDAPIAVSENANANVVEVAWNQDDKQEQERARQEEEARAKQEQELAKQEQDKARQEQDKARQEQRKAIDQAKEEMKKAKERMKADMKRVKEEIEKQVKQVREQAQRAKEEAERVEKLGDKATPQDIERAEKAREEAMAQAERIQEQAEKLQEKMMEQAERMQEQAMQQAERSREQAMKQADKAREQAMKQAEKSRAEAQKARERAQRDRERAERDAQKAREKAEKERAEKEKSEKEKAEKEKNPNG